MPLKESDVYRIAELAKLDMPHTEVASVLDKLNHVFKLVEDMQAIDTTGIAPLCHPYTLIEPNAHLRLREDLVTETNCREKYQQAAQSVEDGLYLVPKVIE